MQTNYNHSRNNLFTRVIREPTRRKPGCIVSLHATKGYRYTTTGRAKSTRFNTAQSFYHSLGAQV